MTITYPQIVWVGGGGSDQGAFWEALRDMELGQNDIFMMRF